MTLSLYPTRLTEAHLKHAYPECWDEELKSTVRLWLRDLQAGIRPLTPRTIQTLRERFIRYTLHLETMGTSPVNLATCLDLKVLYTVISSFPVESYSNRHNTFYSVHSLARFLVNLGELDEPYLLKLKKFRPRRVIPPKRTAIRNQEMLEQLRSAITLEDFRTDWRCLVTRTIVEMLACTGLRNSELCQLRLSDVSIEKCVIQVHLGKGRKNRQIGVSKSLLPYLQEYLEARLHLETESPSFFLNSSGFPFNPSSLGRVIKKLSSISGIAITTHGLRRAFATLNAEQGKPLHLIQLALGHSDIRTTQEYLMSDQEAVIEAMKDW